MGRSAGSEVSGVSAGSGSKGGSGGSGGLVPFILRTANGRLVDRRLASADASGLARVAWTHTLKPGWYILEFGAEERMIRSRFRISP